MDADQTPASLAVLGMTTTTGTPPLIVQAAVLHTAGALITGGPFTYWVAPDTSTGEVPARYWPTLRLAPPWAEVADHLTERLHGRTVVVHEPGRLDVLRRHLPDWHPHGVLVTRELAQQLWPRLNGHDLDTLTAHLTNQRVDHIGPGAVTEARAIALLLGALLPVVTHPALQPTPARPMRLPGAPTALTTDALTDALDQLSRLATRGLTEHLNTDGVCVACGGQAWPCHQAELAEHNPRAVPATVKPLTLRRHRLAPCPADCQNPHHGRCEGALMGGASPLTRRSALVRGASGEC
jgi:hypothetical protein